MISETPSPSCDETFELRAPSRLHFGLFSVGNIVERQFGGVGLMIDHPTTRLQIQSAPALLVDGLETDVVEKLVKRVFHVD